MKIVYSCSHVFCARLRIKTTHIPEMHLAGQPHKRREREKVKRNVVCTIILYAVIHTFNALRITFERLTCARHKCTFMRATIDMSIYFRLVRPIATC